MTEITNKSITLQLRIKLDLYPMLATLSGVKLFDVWSNLFFEDFSDKSKLKPLTPLADAIGLNSMLTLSKLPIEINANWSTPNN